MWDGAQEIPRRVRHVRERGYPVACEQSETRGGEFGRFGYAERDHGVSFTLVGNDDSSLSLGENVAAVVTPAGENDAVAVVVDEFRGKVLAEEWEREATKLFPQHVLLPSVRGLSEGDAWHAEQGLAGFLGDFDVCDLEEPFGRVVEEPRKIRGGT